MHDAVPGSSPTISWDPPSVGTAQAYFVHIFEMSSPGAERVAGIFSQERTVTIPPGILECGHDYAFDVTSRHDAICDLAVTPTCNSVRSGLANLTTGLISPCAD